MLLVMWVVRTRLMRLHRHGWGHFVEPRTAIGHPLQAEEMMQFAPFFRRLPPCAPRVRSGPSTAASAHHAQRANAFSPHDRDSVRHSTKFKCPLSLREAQIET